jgi:hypothetical protein
MNAQVKINETATAMLRKKAALNPTAKKKYLTTIINHELWDKLVAYQVKHNEDDSSIGKVSINSLIETSIKQFLIDK